MWYGQTKDGAGKLRSYARHLDIIAHELAHGLTEFTANLVYLQQSGALNESSSDIFGTIIKTGTEINQIPEAARQFGNGRSAPPWR